MLVECEVAEIGHEPVGFYGRRTITDWIMPRRARVIDAMQRLGLVRDPRGCAALARIDAVLAWTNRRCSTFELQDATELDAKFLTK